MVISGEMLYKQADYLFQHAVAQSPFGRPLLSKMELDMMDADVLIVKDLNAPETPCAQSKQSPGCNRQAHTGATC